MPSGLSAKVLFDYVAEQDDELTLGVGDIISNVIQEDEGWWRGEINGKSGMFPENFVSLINGQPEEKISSTFKAHVKFDYDPEQSDELQLREGEIIEVIETADEGWWKGKIHGKEGMFPSNFVERLDPSKLPVPVSKPIPVPDAEMVKQPEPASDTSTPQSNVMASLFSAIKPGDARNRLKKVAKPAEEDATPVHESSFQHDALKPTQMVPPMNLDHEDSKKINKKIPMIPHPHTDAKPVHTKPVKKAKAIYDYEPEQLDELRLAVGMVITVIDSELTFDGWMKGEVDGKVGVFPDNFVELLPLEQPQQPAVEPVAVPKSQPGTAMLPPGGNPLQNELGKKLALKSPGNNLPLAQKTTNKPPPPPLPGNKPSLPGTKPKPSLPHSKPLKPPLVKPENNADPFDDVKLHVPVDTNPHMQNQQSMPKPFENQPPFTKPFAKADSKPPAVNMFKTPEAEKKSPASASINSTMNNEVNQKIPDESPSSKFGTSKEEKADVKLEGTHSKISAQTSLQLNDVKPTEALKHFDRAKAPGKNLPSKFKDKQSPPVSPTPNNSKEVNELRMQVSVLQTKMDDMEKQFNKLVTQVREDLDTERKLRLSQQVELDSLKKKVDIWLGK